MSFTRRSFLSAAAVFPVSGAVKFGEEMHSGDVAILLVDSSGGRFAVGVRAPVKASHHFVEVFYHVKSQLRDSAPISLLLVQESLGVMGVGQAYGLTNLDFDCPKESIEFIQVTFLNVVGESVEFGREKSKKKRGPEFRGALELRRRQSCGDREVVRS